MPSRATRSWAWERRKSDVDAVALVDLNTILADPAGVANPKVTE